MSRFDYVKYNDAAQKISDAFKNKFKDIEESLEALEDGRAKSLALTALEEAFMWVGKQIRDQQVKNCPPEVAPAPQAGEAVGVVVAGPVEVKS